MNGLVQISDQLPPSRAAKISTIYKHVKEGQLTIRNTVRQLLTKLTMEELQQMCTEMEMQVFVDDTISNCVVATICGSIIVVEMNENSDVNRVSVSYAVDVEKDDNIPAVLYNNFKAEKIGVFIENMNYLAELDRLAAALPNQDVFHAALCIRKDISDIVEKEKKVADEAVRLGYGFGILNDSFIYLSILFWASKLNQTRRESEDAPLKGHTLSIHLQTEGQMLLPPVKSTFLNNGPIARKISSLLPEMNVFDPTGGGLAFDAQYVMKLDTKIPIFSSLYELIKLVVQSDIDLNAIQVMDLSSIPVYGSKLETDFLKIKDGSEHVSPDNERWHFNFSGEPYDACLLSEIHFTHVQQVLPILQIMRAQLVFNELLTSAFSNETETVMEEMTIANRLVEVFVPQPLMIGILFVHPVDNEFVELFIEVPLTQSVEVAVMYNEQAAFRRVEAGILGDHDRLSQALRVCHNIPVFLEWLVKRLNKAVH